MNPLSVALRRITLYRSRPKRTRHSSSPLTILSPCHASGVVRARRKYAIFISRLITDHPDNLQLYNQRGEMEEIIEARVHPTKIWKAWVKAHAVHGQSCIESGQKGVSKGEGKSNFRYQV